MYLVYIINCFTWVKSAIHCRCQVIVLVLNGTSKLSGYVANDLSGLSFSPRQNAYYILQKINRCRLRCFRSPSFSRTRNPSACLGLFTPAFSRLNFLVWWPTRNPNNAPEFWSRAYCREIGEVRPRVRPALASAAKADFSTISWSCDCRPRLFCRTSDCSWSYRSDFRASGWKGFGGNSCTHYWGAKG